MTETTLRSPTPPRPPRLRRGDRLHTIAAGSIAVLAVLGCILIINIANDPPVDEATLPAAAPSAAEALATDAPPAGITPVPGTTTAAPPTPSAASTPPAPQATSVAPPAAVAPGGERSKAPKHVFTPVVILNNSRISGLADAARARVERAGFTVVRVGNYTSAYDVPVPTVFYDPVHEAAAMTMLELIPDVRAATPKNANFISDDPFILVITKDFKTELQ